MVIETMNLTKLYGNKIGCKDISLYVEKGKVFGLLGPNGAGKSTFIKLLTGLLFPTSGSAYILSEPAGSKKALGKIGYLPENFKYQSWMTGKELLQFHSELYGINKNKIKSKIDEVLEMVNLKGQEKYNVGTYSKGMQQRIGLAAAILNDPDLLFLDEPTSALDPLGRKEVRDIIIKLKESGKTVLLNSHLLSEVESVSDCIGIINKGSLIKFGELNEVLKSEIKLNIVLKATTPEIITILKGYDDKIDIKDNKVILNIKDLNDIPKINSSIVSVGAEIFELTPVHQSLETAFLNMVKGSDIPC